MYVIEKLRCELHKLTYTSVGVLRRYTVPILPAPPSWFPHFQSDPNQKFINGILFQILNLKVANIMNH